MNRLSLKCPLICGLSCALLLACAKQPPDVQQRVAEAAAPRFAQAPVAPAEPVAPPPVRRVAPTQAERAHANQVFEAMKAKLQASVTKPVALLSVPTFDCRRRACERDDSASGIHYYGEPGVDFSSPMGLWVDEDRAFWIFEPHNSRVVGFGRDRKLKRAVKGFDVPVTESVAFAIEGSVAHFVGWPSGNPASPRLYSVPFDHEPDDDVPSVELVGRGSLLRFRPGDGRALAWSRGSWSTSNVRGAPAGISIDDPAPLMLAGREVSFSCDGPVERREGTLYIGDQARALPSCEVIPRYFAQSGEIYLSDGDDTVLWKLDASGELVAGALIPPPVLDAWWPSRVGAGPDGTIYAWIPKRHSIDFVRLELTPR